MITTKTFSAKFQNEIAVNVTNQSAWTEAEELTIRKQNRVLMSGARCKMLSESQRLSQAIGFYKMIESGKMPYGLPF